MATTIAVARRVSASKSAHALESSRRLTGSIEWATSTPVLCPKCGEVYHLIEESDIVEETLHDDLEFLTRALSTGHPWHPEQMIVRDPSGALTNRCYLETTAEDEVNKPEVPSANSEAAVAV